MSRLFDAWAGDYDEARPGYPPDLVEAIRVYHGGVPGALVAIRRAPNGGRETGAPGG